MEDGPERGVREGESLTPDESYDVGEKEGPLRGKGEPSGDSRLVED